jgi:GntR family transcriptional regulator
MERRPLYLSLADSLVTKIAEGHLRPGDKLPAEHELARAYGVSRITVRQAMDLLSRRGLIERFPKRGSFVASPPSVSVWTINSTDDFSRLAAETDLQVIDWKAIEPPSQVARLLGVAGEKVYRLRGVRRRGGVPLYYVEVYTLPGIGRRLDRHDLGGATVIELIETKLGIPVGSGAEEISAGVADEALAKRLCVRPGAPVLILDVTFFGVDGRPLEYARACYRADQFKRRNQLTRSRRV